MPTAWNRTKLLEAGLPGERVHTVAQGVDSWSFRPGLPPIPLPSPGVRLVFGRRDPLLRMVEGGQAGIGGEQPRPFVFTSVFKW